MATRRTSTVQERTLPVPEEELRRERFERIAARAFELYEARGGEHGQAMDDWLEAERQIDLEFGPIDREVDTDDE